MPSLGLLVSRQCTVMHCHGTAPSLIVACSQCSEFRSSLARNGMSANHGLLLSKEALNLTPNGKDDFPSLHFHISAVNILCDPVMCWCCTGCQDLDCIKDLSISFHGVILYGCTSCLEWNAEHWRPAAAAH